MTNNKHTELMESISSIYNLSKGSKMRKDLFNEIEKELSTIAAWGTFMLSLKSKSGAKKRRQIRLKQM